MITTDFEPTVPEPSEEDIERMILGHCDTVAIDGCEPVDPDGCCEHGQPSWLVYMGLI